MQRIPRSGNTGVSPLLPVITFLSIVIVGLVITLKIYTNPEYRLSIILFSILIAFFVSGYELRTLAKMKVRKETKLSDKDKELELAKFVADLFDEDIPFEEIDKREN